METSLWSLIVEAESITVTIPKRNEEHGERALADIEEMSEKPMTLHIGARTVDAMIANVRDDDDVIEYDLLPVQTFNG